MTAKIIPFPGGGREAPEGEADPPAQPERSCFDCEHASLGAMTYCSLFKEEILFESYASECEDFEPLPGSGAADG